MLLQGKQFSHMAISSSGSHLLLFGVPPHWRQTGSNICQGGQNMLWDLNRHLITATWWKGSLFSKLCPFVPVKGMDRFEGLLPAHVVPKPCGHRLLGIRQGEMSSINFEERRSPMRSKLAQQLFWASVRLCEALPEPELPPGSGWVLSSFRCSQARVLMAWV